MADFPYPGVDSKTSIIQIIILRLLPLFIVICFSINLTIIIKHVVEEKETGVKELMKVMGLKTWLVWIGWLINVNMINIFTVCIITIVLTVSFKNGVPPILQRTDPFILWLLLFLFMNATTVYVFVACAFIHKPLIASAVGMMMYMLPYFILGLLLSKITVLWQKILLCLLPVINVITGVDTILHFVMEDDGVTWEDIFMTASGKETDLCIAAVYLMFLVEIALFSFLIWYFDNVRPGPFGRAKPWYFIFLDNVSFRQHCTQQAPPLHSADEKTHYPETQCCKRKEKVEVLTEDVTDTRYFEQPPEGANVGISIRNLTKIFPPNVHAVKGVNIDIYKGQITALLGHNGAGKTTTLSIIAGLYSPTTGTVHEHLSDTEKYNIFDNMERFRSHLGLCPQNNMLFTYLTVSEHLIFFGMLKGYSYQTAKKKGFRLLQILNMDSKMNSTPNRLSGGMKRKLSLAISLIGEPKVLIMDEPTSGMDPESRREMWDLLLGSREGRTTIITTHHMEEADALGDQIAIMSHGKVFCYGSSMFLKRIYGAGYDLTLVIDSDANERKISHHIKKAVPGAKLKPSQEGQLVYNLPAESSSKFDNLFSRIEGRKKELHITSIGVSCTTMEDVFLKVGELSQFEETKSLGSVLEYSEDGEEEEDEEQQQQEEEREEEVKRKVTGSETDGEEKMGKVTNADKGEKAEGEMTKVDEKEEEEEDKVTGVEEEKERDVTEADKERDGEVMKTDEEKERGVTEVDGEEKMGKVTDADKEEKVDGEVTKVDEKEEEDEDKEKKEEEDEEEEEEEEEEEREEEMKRKVTGAEEVKERDVTEADKERDGEVMKTDEEKERGVTEADGEEKMGKVTDADTGEKAEGEVTKMDEKDEGGPADNVDKPPPPSQGTSGN